jgi:hypothetical protein
MAADEVVAGAGVEQGNARGIAVQDDSLVVQYDRVAGGLEDGLVLGEGTFPEQALRDVLHRNDGAADFARIVEQRCCLHLSEEGAAVRAPEGVRPAFQGPAGGDDPIDRAIGFGITDSEIVGVAGQGMAFLAQDRLRRVETEQTDGGSVQEGEATRTVEAEHPCGQVVEQHP